MFVSPGEFASAAGLPEGVPAIIRGYGERIVLLGAVYLVIAWSIGKGIRGSEKWAILPLIDELWNTASDSYEWLTGGLPAEAAVGMTVFS